MSSLIPRHDDYSISNGDKSLIGGKLRDELPIKHKTGAARENSVPVSRRSPKKLFEDDTNISRIEFKNQ